MIPPDDFIGLAEQTGLIGELTLFVLREAVARCKEWQILGFDLSVSVNVSARSLHDLQLPTRVAEVLEESGLDPTRLVLEITESTVMSNVERSMAQLAELRALGVSISLDDYGTGHSSLAQLKHLPIDELKIDRSFITHMTENSDDALIAASTIDLARRLGLRVVAEGVETQAAYEHLRELGCHVAQGYLFSRPLPPDEFAAWLCAQRVPTDARRPFPATEAPVGAAVEAPVGRGATLFN
jgi:EAL domain-containing protein (putative c-di-GMP-specific phosphodiesterase class I)